MFPIFWDCFLVASLKEEEVEHGMEIVRERFEDIIRYVVEPWNSTL